MKKIAPFNPAFRLPWTAPAAFQDVPVPQRDWLVEDLIPAHAVTMISGDGGLGKSLLAMQLMTCCAIDKDWLGRKTKPVKCMGVFCEDELNELHYRQDAINRHYGCDFRDLGNVQWLSRVGEDNTLVNYVTRTEHGERREEFEESYLISHIENAAYKFGAQLVVMDSLHDLYGGNENDRRQARQFIQILRELAIGINGAVVLLAHPSLSGMSAGTGSAGSTAWNNAVRSRLYLTRPKPADGDPEDRDGRILKTMKANYGAVGGEVRLRYEDGVFVCQQRGPQSGFDARMEERNRERLALDAIRSLARNKIAISVKPRATNYAPKMIARAGAMAGYTPKEIERVVQGLWARGVIHEAEIGRGADRHPITSVVIREDNGNAEMS
jgi:RecA-family ATPase